MSRRSLLLVLALAAIAVGGIVFHLRVELFFQPRAWSRVLDRAGLENRSELEARELDEALVELFALQGEELAGVGRFELHLVRGIGGVTAYVVCFQPDRPPGASNHRVLTRDGWLMEVEYELPACERARPDWADGSVHFVWREESFEALVYRWSDSAHFAGTIEAFTLDSRGAAPLGPVLDDPLWIPWPSDPAALSTEVHGVSPEPSPQQAHSLLTSPELGDLLRGLHVLDHATLEPDEIARLARHPAAWVRAIVAHAIAGHGAAPGELSRLLNDRSPNVRYAALVSFSNQTCTGWLPVVSGMAHDAHPHIAEYAHRILTRSVRPEIARASLLWLLRRGRFLDDDDWWDSWQEFVQNLRRLSSAELADVLLERVEKIGEEYPWSVWSTVGYLRPEHMRPFATRLWGLYRGEHFVAADHLARLESPEATEMTAQLAEKGVYESSDDILWALRRRERPIDDARVLAMLRRFAAYAPPTPGPTAEDRKVARANEAKLLLLSWGQDAMVERLPEVEVLLLWYRCGQTLLESLAKRADELEKWEVSNLVSSGSRTWEPPCSPAVVTLARRIVTKEGDWDRRTVVEAAYLLSRCDDAEGSERFDALVDEALARLDSGDDEILQSGPWATLFVLPGIWRHPGASRIAARALELAAAEHEFLEDGELEEDLYRIGFLEYENLGPAARSVIERLVESKNSTLAALILTRWDPRASREKLRELYSGQESGALTSLVTGFYGYPFSERADVPAALLETLATLESER